MTIEDVIKKDIETNNSNISIEDAISIYNNYVNNGALVYRVGNTLFIITDTIDSYIYFHTINADTFKDFVHNANIFFRSIDYNKYSRAITYFSNRKLKCFFYKPYTYVEEIKEGMFKYSGIIDLKELNGMG